MKTSVKIILSLITIIYVGISTRCLNPVDGSRILAISQIGGKSHWNFMAGILRALTDHGHHVTVLTPFADGNRENYTEVFLPSRTNDSLQRLDVVLKLFAGCTSFVSFAHALSRRVCKKVYGHDFIAKTIADRHSGPGFDVIVTELVASECMSRLAVELNVPLIYVIPPPLISYVERPVLGHYPNPSVVSHVLADHGVPRTFAERLTNTALLVHSTCLLWYKSWTVGAADRQHFDRVESVKPSIVFTNAHYIADAARQLPPNVVPVGGIHLSPPNKLPDDVFEFIENSPHGVVFFSLGSVLLTSSLSEHVQKTIIKVLGQIPQRVLLKHEHEIKDKPENIMTRKWFPQRDILMHPNVKLFISHGGISGVYEAVDAGVPVLGFPMFFDQPRNLKNLIDAGMAMSMDLLSLTEDPFMKAISELVNDEKYSTNAKIASELFKDRPMTPAQTIDYWTSYVIRHNGAPHMKSRALNMTWYQYGLLDVIIVLSLTVGFGIYICLLVSRIVYRYFVFYYFNK